MEQKAFIASCAGTSLTDRERVFFAEARPCGLIVFARNCRTPDQLRALTSAFKQAVGNDEVLLLIDQEGGRVQRLRPPHWRDMPVASRYGLLYADDPTRGKDAAFAGARLTADELRDVGINGNAAPDIDVPQPGSHEIIGNRAYSTDPEVVIALGRAVMDGCLAGGVLPVIKHVPGHGRAKADSHLTLPRIDATRAELEATDFKPFQALRDAPLAMTAHVLLLAFDDRRPATLSPVIMQVIREELGLQGLVMSDDIGMEALGGPFGERARAIIDAGCDVVLHCSGAFGEMVEVAKAVPPLRDAARERFAQAWVQLRKPEDYDEDAALALVAEAARAGQAIA